MTTAREAVAALDALVGARIPNVDGPDVFGDPEALMLDTLAGLTADVRDDLLEVMEHDDDWRLLVAVSSRHPDLAALEAWAERSGDVLLVASPRGPTPPAAAFLERAGPAAGDD